MAETFSNILDKIKEAQKKAQPRKTPFCVIAKEAVGEFAIHDIQRNSSWGSNPYGEAYAVVPDDLVQGILETGGFCDIELNEDGTEVVSYTAKEKPEIPQAAPEPTTEEDLLSMAIDHEYRLTLLELGVV